MFTYSHANKPLGQSERAYYLSYFIISDVSSGINFTGYCLERRTLEDRYSELPLLISLSMFPGRFLSVEICSAFSSFLSVMSSVFL